MTHSSSVPPADDLDLQTLGAALWRAKGRIIALSLLAAVITFIGLSMMRPLYTSEARILVQNEETAFTRPTTEQGTTNYRTALDEQAIQSQVQVLSSRDLILKVVRDLDLAQNAAFAEDARGTFFQRLLKSIGLGRPSRQSPEERAATVVADNMSVYQLAKSSVIAVDYTSGDPQLAAKIANGLADAYIDWQRDTKIEQTKDATAWLDAQIKALRAATAESEEAVEAFKASEGLYAGSNNVALNAQQLSELNSQLILAEAQESEAQARAKLIKDMLATNGDIDATPEVLNSQLVINLIEQRVLVQRQLAELSATLLPSHPRIQQLRSELADVRAQVRTEAQKVVSSLENQAQIAAAREASLRASLTAAKNRTAGQSDAEVKLRALEREAKANRDLLESYLASYRDASARHDIGAAPAQAAIVSRAHAPVLPSFPRRGPLTLLILAATALLSIGTVLAKTIIVSGGPRRAASTLDYSMPNELLPTEPEYMSRAEMLALSRMNAEGRRQPRAGSAGYGGQPRVETRRTTETRAIQKAKRRPIKTAQSLAPEDAPRPSKTAPTDRAPSENAKSMPAQPARIGSAQPDGQKSAAERPPSSRNLPAKTDAPPAGPKAEAEPKTKPADEAATDAKAGQPEKAGRPDGAQRSGTKSVWRAAKPAKRPSWLAVSEPRSADLDTTPAKPVAEREEQPSNEQDGQQPKAPTKTPSKAPAKNTAKKTTPPKKLAPPAKKASPARPNSNPDPKPAQGDSRRQEPQDEGPNSLAGLAAPAAAGSPTPAKTPTRPMAKPSEPKGAPESLPAREEAQAASAMSFIQRIRQDVINQDETEPTLAPASRRSAGLLDRFRGKQRPERNVDSSEEPTSQNAGRRAGPRGQESKSMMARLSPNDLRHYLTQRIAGSEATEKPEPAAEPHRDADPLGPVIGSLDEVLDTILESSTGGLPRTMLVAGTSSGAPSPEAAIWIARDLATSNEQVALVDLAKGAAVVSGRLGMPRVPGFSDLAVGEADFADVVKIDDGSPLQIIPAGNPALNDDYDAPDKFMRVFEALTQTYDCVVLHADMAAIESLMPALKFELPVAVAVLPPRTAPEAEREPLSVVQRLGCPVVLYGAGGKGRRPRFSIFGRKEAV